MGTRFLHVSASSSKILVSRDTSMLGALATHGVALAMRPMLVALSDTCRPVNGDEEVISAALLLFH